MRRIRCEEMDEGTDSQCVLENNHGGDHQIPNLLLKLENRFLFDRLRNNPYVLNKGDSLFMQIELLNGFNAPQPAGEKDKGQ